MFTKNNKDNTVAIERTTVSTFPNQNSSKAKLNKELTANHLS